MNDIEQAVMVVVPTEQQHKTEYPILIVEDEQSSRVLLEHTLLKEGYYVQSARDGYEAQEILKHKYFPIVITDWLKPDMGGVSLCRVIRDGSFPGYVYIIFLTANDSKHDLVRGLQAGADDYLVKPFSHAELIARLSAAERILASGHALQKASQEIRKASITDPLTGVYNRVYLSERLPQEISRAVRYGHSLSVIIVDIDRFKAVNDTFGQRGGDLVLQQFADLLQRHIRSEVDWIARFGGEEFVLVLPETRLENAIRMAERARKHIERHHMMIDPGHHLLITASMGVAELLCCDGDRGYSFDALMEQADRCLCQAKKEGSNRIKVFSKWDLGIDQRFLVAAQQDGDKGLGLTDQPKTTE